MKQKGFTLIELMIVIAIIGILSSVVLTSLNSSRAKARDSLRRQEMKQLQIALQLYYEDHSSYPNTGSSWYSSEPGNNVTDNGGDYIPSLAPGYIGSLPRDPKGGAANTAMIPPCSGGWKSAYLYLSNGTDYKLISHCAPESPYNPNDPFMDPLRSPPGGWPFHAWAVCSTQAFCLSN